MILICDLNAQQVSNQSRTTRRIRSPIAEQGRSRAKGRKVRRRDYPGHREWTDSVAGRWYSSWCHCCQPIQTQAILQNRRYDACWERKSAHGRSSGCYLGQTICSEKARLTYHRQGCRRNFGWRASKGKSCKILFCKQIGLGNIS